MDIALKMKVPVLAFPQTNHVGDRAQVCDTSQLMADQVKQLIADKKHLNILQPIDNRILAIKLGKLKKF